MKQPTKKPYLLTLAWLYPDLMSTYGDRGNVIALTKRCEWRGIEVEIRSITPSSSEKELSTSDLIFMGGGEDRQQKIVAKDLKSSKGQILQEMIEKEIPGLYICGAYQFLGKYYKEADGAIIEGLGILDLHTENPGHDTPRLIGNVAAQLLLPNTQTTIVGFENHGGRTYLGESIKPLGKIIYGSGNNGKDGYEGVVYKNSLGSYFHGPLLPKNPYLADFLITKALEKKYQQEISLPALDDTLEKRAHAAIARRLSVTV